MLQTGFLIAGLVAAFVIVLAGPTVYIARRDEAEYQKYREL